VTDISALVEQQLRLGSRNLVKEIDQDIRIEYGLA
jgi:hypothetical protein